ncbi:class I SAM-dependent DNA methyltransferase [Geminocystis sp. NIES-3709]|uniref:type I restriction-modification system subunit M n=1 Tax=Geminocystis sp. NIES-3709 TaxID=1617448 RepID=UPI0005FC4FB8|nr:class I SAM-dependent DNA methyltransferase [Geminocystis sp. NIES-3709]BAQ66963.1 type I restriction-modification system [Geminocystis sp. NIES-3709]
MDLSTHNKLVSFIWSIADDCLRDIFVRGKYRDVILPMFVLRRLDCLLEGTKDKVMEEVRFQREEVGLVELDAEGLREASGYVFYNISDWTLKKLVTTAANNAQILEANFKAYLDGFSDDVKEIIDKFDLRNQIRKMSQADVLLDVLEKFTSPEINLSPHEVTDNNGRKLAGLTNLGMGYVFEELIRRFNEENNEEAGEHFTPREVIRLMTHLLFIPVKDQLPPVILVYDGACGSGGMLTESQNFIQDSQGEIASSAVVNLYGKEVNGETYAICKSDMMIKGNNPENIKFGSTLATDDFAGIKFDFMLANPPYGKSWKTEQRYIMDGNNVLDPRFEVSLTDFWGEIKTEKAVPRSSDGQLLFLMDMVGKIKPLSLSPLGSRIASVHNGSALFTGDAGSGESNIRRYIIENDYLEAIVQLPQNLFYNTGISTYIWILSNHKAPHRKGKVQLIDASNLYRKLRKNLGAKNCEFAPEDIETITNIYLSLHDDNNHTFKSLTNLSSNNLSSNKISGELANKISEELSNKTSEELSNEFSSRESLSGFISIVHNNQNEEQKFRFPLLNKQGIKECVSKVFNNEDFGFYKVTVERPLRLMAQFTPDRIASLRFVSAIAEAMEWIYNHLGEKVYQDLKAHEKDIKAHLEKEEISITPANLKTLLSQKKWLEQKELMVKAQKIATGLETITGTNNNEKIWTDFNLFTQEVDRVINQLKIKLSASEKKQILGAVSWVDESAEKVIKKVHKLKKDKLEELLNQLGITVNGRNKKVDEPNKMVDERSRIKENLANFGYFSTDKPDVYVEYESDTNLRDTENIPLNYYLSSSTIDENLNINQNLNINESLNVNESLKPSTFAHRVAIIEDYFLEEVRPHVEDAWLDMSKTVIGYEISFNKYFYQHQPLRSLQEVSKEMLELEAQTDGLLKNLVSFAQI